MDEETYFALDVCLSGDWGVREDTAVLYAREIARALGMGGRESGK